VELQAAMRGLGVRDRLARKKNRLKRAEKGVVALQSLVRGQMIRALFDDHLKDYRTSVEWATMVVLMRW
jgi:hypothetical protein